MLVGQHFNLPAIKLKADRCNHVARPATSSRASSAAPRSRPVLPRRSTAEEWIWSTSALTARFLARSSRSWRSVAAALAHREPEADNGRYGGESRPFHPEEQDGKKPGRTGCHRRLEDLQPPAPEKEYTRTQTMAHAYVGSNPLPPRRILTRPHSPLLLAGTGRSDLSHTRAGQHFSISAGQLLLESKGSASLYSASRIAGQPIFWHRLKRWRGAVSIREAGVLDRPVYPDCRVVPQDGAAVLGGVVVRAFVGEERVLGGDDEAVGEAGGHPELAPVLCGEGHARPSSEGRGTDPDVHGRVEDLALQHGDELALGSGVLKVEPTEHGAG